jgi:VanZ family protein
LGFIDTGSINVRNRLFICTLIAAAVAVADEIHQAFIPNREGSITDVLLDLLGIILVLFVVKKLLKAESG